MKDKKIETHISKIWLFPLVIVAVFVPVVIMVHNYDSGLGQYAWFGSGVTEVCDVYLYYKSLLIIVCGAIALVFVVGLYIRNKPTYIYDKRNIIPITFSIIFILLTIISSLFATSTWDASFGGIDRFEGCYVILSYVVFFYFAFGYARSIDILKLLLDAIMVGASIVGLIGTLEALGINIYKWDWVQSLLFFIEDDNSLITFTESGLVSSTLENPNYAGSYVALVLPYCFYLLLKGEKIWRRVVAGITIEFLGIYLYGSYSDTGIIAIIFGVCVCVFFLFPNLNRKSKIAVCGVALFVLVVITGILIEHRVGNNIMVERFIPSMENIKTEANSLIISTSNNKTIKLSINDNLVSNEGWSQKYKIDDIISLSDAIDGSSINTRKNSLGRKEIHQNGYPSLSFYLAYDLIPKKISPTGEEYKLDTFHIVDGLYDFKFGTFLGSNICYIYNITDERVFLRDIDRVGFEGRYSLASGRGYIWACTLPLLKNYIILGAGQDNYIYVFPNDDYIGKKYYGYDRMYIQKPHNLYLGIWVQQGLIALLLYLSLYGLFIIRVVRLCYGKNKISTLTGFSPKGVAVMTAVGTTAYMVAGLANDSNVGVTPIYWVMLGVGYAAEAICRKEADPSDDATKELPDVSGIIGDEDDIIVEDTTFEEL